MEETETTRNKADRTATTTRRRRRSCVVVVFVVVLTLSVAYPFVSAFAPASPPHLPGRVTSPIVDTRGVDPSPSSRFASSSSSLSLSSLFGAMPSAASVVASTVLRCGAVARRRAASASLSYRRLPSSTPPLFVASCGDDPRYSLCSQPCCRPRPAAFWSLSPPPLTSLMSSSSSSLSSSSSTSTSSSSKLKSSFPTNEELVAARLAAAAERKSARRRALKADRERNLRLKRLMHSDATAVSSEDADLVADGGSASCRQLYQVRVSVCPDLRSELRMNGREKRGRMFVEYGSDGTRTLRGLRKGLHEFFRALKKGRYVLWGGLPEVTEDGKIIPPPEESDDPSTTAPSSDLWPIESDDDVLRTFVRADEFHSDPNSPGRLLKRPSILLHVRKDPNAPPPPEPPSYLVDMPDPNVSPSMTMLSFYSFPPGGIANPESFASCLGKTWKPFGALGRVYVATEGVNAQMSVPTNVMDRFMDCCRSVEELGESMENGINVDPIPLSREKFAVAGDMNGKPAPPFKNLHIRVRNQVVADGLDRPLDWQSAGYDMPPLEWHQKLKEARDKRAAGQGADDDDGRDRLPLILDCRNSYETEVGKFEGAEPLDTEAFRDSWDVLKDRLRDTPKDAPIMTYCTGGIRCVKVGAYLTQEMGFTNVSRLAGGIIAYDRTLKEKAAEEEPLFKGTNFVFDGRVGRTITNDAMGECVTCGESTNLVGNCANDNCHRRIVQCESCRTSFSGACSDACQKRVVFQWEKAAVASEIGTSQVEEEEEQKLDDSPSSGTRRTTYGSLDEYSSGHTSPAPSLFREIELNTAHFLPTGAHMVSGSTQGRLLAQLASMTRDGRILELGTFTGYAAACFLEGSANAAESLSSSSGGGSTTTVGGRGGGPFVLTVERDAEAIDLAVSHLRVMSKFGVGEEAAERICAMRGEGGSVPEVTERSVSLSYKGAGCEILKVTDALATIEEMARGEGSDPPAPFDIVFIDADKTRLLDYVEACVGSDRLLKKGGFILVDNVLWKGLVLGASAGWSRAWIEEEDEGMTDWELRKNRRARKLASVMHRFNDAVTRDERLEVVLLPLRDGLSIIRKR